MTNKEIKGLKVVFKHHPIYITKFASLKMLELPKQKSFKNDIDH
jgi:hypothetical protein